MKEYRVARVTTTPNWEKVERAAVDLAPWGHEYRPETYAQVVYHPGKGFLVRMTCAEQKPKAVFENDDDPVCKDSCMEFFADFAPETGKGYLNFEANSIGTLLIGLGTERHGRVRPRELGYPLPEICPFATATTWGYELFIPLTLIERIYGKTEFAAGDRFRANFYKCGDETAQPHYCVWNPVVAASPDYHRPECFGTLIVE